ncbi:MULTISPECIES: hypothetical protein [Niastella]|uniref:VTC domain-containing protein n=1 Tax=Niastella soli TaxID=2821487 RepID=A0ABS3YM54_9BACT|nr:hypothetical protein [Niastella soli]MBO9198979.1 hypothetical protein [Niastella soli]
MNFDYVNFKPLDKIELPYYFPYLRVFSDSAGIKRVEAYWTKKGPEKVYNRIRFKGFEAYESSSKFLGSTTVDTIIVGKDKLFEFKCSYYGKEVSQQSAMIYKKNGRDKLDVDYFGVYNLYKDRTGQIPADTVVHVPVEKTLYSFEKDSYEMVWQDQNIRIHCKTRTSGGCYTGISEKLVYTYLGCFYWSLSHDLGFGTVL